MARPYSRVGTVNTTPIVEDNGEETTWDRMDSFRVPMAPGVEMPLALNRHLEYRLTYDGQAWRLDGRPARRPANGPETVTP